MSAGISVVSEKYCILEQVGEGTYGQVYKGKCLTSGKLVALKKFRIETEKEGFSLTAIREIKILQALSHINIVKMIEIVMASPLEKDIFIVFDYIEHDLSGLMKSENASNLFKLQQSEFVIKGIMYQLLQGLKYLHETAGIIHRDMKCPNILIDKFGCVKLADFGLAKLFNGPFLDGHYISCSVIHPIMTNRVITLWYRPPEVLFGDDHYGPEVDIWGIGCIFAELLLLKPAFSGSDEVSQIEAILMGLFSGQNEPFSCLSHLPWYNLIPDQLKRNYVPSSGSSNLFDSLSEAGVDPEALNILRLMLSIDPKKRINCKNALESKYFEECSQPRFMESYRKVFESFSTNGLELKGNLPVKSLK